MSVERHRMYDNSPEIYYGFSYTSKHYWFYGSDNNFPLWIDTFQHINLVKNAFYIHKRPYSMGVEFVVSGRLDVTINNETHKLYANEAIILPSGSKNSIKCNEMECKKIFFSLIGSQVEPILNSLNIKIGSPLKFNDPKRFIDLLHQFDNILVKKKHEDISEAYAFAHKILMEIKMQCSAPDFHPALSKAINLMNGISNLNIKVEDVATELGIAYETLYLIFKKELHITPKQYLTQIRMQKAKTLLINTKLTINEIAYSCGYKLPIVFSREFNRHFNMTPRIYRKINLGNSELCT